MYKSREKAVPMPEKFSSVTDGLKTMYGDAIASLEGKYKYETFHPKLTPADFDAAPMVMLMGQYSVGKTTFIRFLLGEDFPGIRIGPEPTTDRFVAVMHGKDKLTIPGNALSAQIDAPFQATTRFGSGFLNHFEASVLPNPLLEQVTLVDTPGVLSGAKQREGRAYEMNKVIEWFATKVDRILLLFDAHKLDISDEFKDCILALKGNDDKIRCVLNKADSIDGQRLLRVYGALMWSLGKVVQSPEVLRVYVGSFWDKPLQHKDNEELFIKEADDLLSDLYSLPRQSAIRRINELVKRTRTVKVHALICSQIRENLPTMGKKKKQDAMFNDLPTVFYQVQQKNNLPMGDFPDVSEFKDKMENWDFGKFPKIESKEIQKVMGKIDVVLGEKIPALMKQFPADQQQKEETADTFNPFADENADWNVGPGQKEQFDMMFYGLEPKNGKLSGGQCKQALIETGLNTKLLGKLWNLADIDKDGCLDIEEFAVAMKLAEHVNNGEQLPVRIENEWLPPGKREGGSNDEDNPFA